MPSQYQEGSLKPLASGLNDELFPTLIGDSQAASLENVRFDKRSLEAVDGFQKINHDRPVSAGLRFRPPTGKQVNSIDDGQLPQGGYVAIPYSAAQHTISASVDLQIDVAFRIEGPGLDASALGEPGQFVPLVSRGGSGVEPLVWSLGYAVSEPGGVSLTNAKRMRPAFMYWDEGSGYKFCEADVQLISGQDYFLSLILDGSTAADGQWVLDGVNIDDMKTDESSTIHAVLPRPRDLSTFEGAIYIGRVWDCTTGRTPCDGTSWPGSSDALYCYQPFLSGLDGLETDVDVRDEVITNSAGGRQSVKLPGPTEAGVTAADDWIGYYLCSPTTNAEAVGEVRYIDDSFAGGKLEVAGTGFSEVFGANDEVNLRPLWQPVYHDTTIAEVRLWKGTDATTTLDLVGKEAFESFEDPAPFNRAPVTRAVNLLGYWPLNDDGGVVCKDLSPFRNHGYMVPGSFAYDEEKESYFLDGDSQAIYLDLNDENLGKDLNSHLGADGKYRIMVRAKFKIGHGTVNPDLYNTGDPTDVLDADCPYQTIFSWDEELDSATYRPVFELRLVQNRGGTDSSVINKFVAVWSNSDAATQTATFGSTAEITIGEDYLMYFGVDHYASDSKHHAWLIITTGATKDPTDQPIFDVAYSSVTAVEFDNDKTRLMFGASVVPHPTATQFGTTGGKAQPGQGAHQFAMLLVSELGINLASAETYLPSTSAFNKLLRFDRMEEEDLLVDLGGGSLVVDAAKGSATLTATTGGFFDNSVVNAKGWPIILGDDKFTEKDLNKAALPVQRIRLATAHDSTGITMSSDFELETKKSIRVQALAMLAHSLMEPTNKDLVLSPAVETDDLFAKTPGAFKTFGPLNVDFGIAVAPSRVGIPFSLMLPEWSNGLAKGTRPRIDGLYQYKKTDGSRHLIAASRGSIFDVDSRWRKDNPFPEENPYSIEFRTIPKAEARRRDRHVAGQPSSLTDPIARDEVRVEIAASSNGGLGPSVGSLAYQIESWVKCDNLEGIRTIQAGTTKAAGVLALNHQVGLSDGAPFFRFGNWRGTDYQTWGVAGKPYAASSEGGTVTLNTAKALVTAGKWTHLVFHISYGADDAFDTMTVAIDGQWFTMTKLTDASPALDAGDITALANGVSVSVGSLVGERECLGGRMAGIRFMNVSAGGGYTSGTNFVPTAIGIGDFTGSEEITFEVPMTEGSGVELAGENEIGSDKFAVIESLGMIPLARGLGRLRKSEGHLPYSFAVFNDTLFGTNGQDRPFQFKDDETSGVGLDAPTHGPTLSQRLMPLHPGPRRGTVIVQGMDTHTSATGQKIRVDNTKTFRFTPDMVGWKVFVPPQEEMNGAGIEYAGIITSVVAGDVGLEARVLPQIGNDQRKSTHANNFEMSCVLYEDDATTLADGTTITTSEHVYQRMAEMGDEVTSYNDSRLKPGAQDAIVSGEFDTGDQIGSVNASALQLDGNHVVHVAATEGLEASNGQVFEFMAYVKFSDLSTNGDETIPLVEKRTSTENGNYVLEMWDSGKLRFKFFDASIADFRSIETVGRVFTTGEWYYVRFRYKFKDSSKTNYDTTGGWEYDRRVWDSGVSGLTPAGEGYRDGLWVYALENKNPADPLLVIPGCASAFANWTASNDNANDEHELNKQRSGEITNTGALLSAPYITPEDGHAAAGADGLLSSVKVVLVSKDEAGVSENAVGVGTQIMSVIVTGTSDFFFTRSMSRMRHMAPVRHKEGVDYGSNQPPSDSRTTVIGTYTGADCAYKAPAYKSNKDLDSLPEGEDGVASGLVGNTNGRAIMVKVLATTDGSGGADVGRILALEHLGQDDQFIGDVGMVPVTTATSATGTSLALSDDLSLGADGGGALASGNTETLDVVIYWPNGVAVSDKDADPENIGYWHTATGNLTALPTLLQHGDNPVGVNDNPAPSTAGTNFLGSDLTVLSGGAISGFKGICDELALSIKDFDTDIETCTPDHMPEQDMFRGPINRDAYSGTPLNFTATATNGEGNGTSGKPTIAFRFQGLKGDVLEKDAQSDEDVPSGKIEPVSDKLAPAGAHTFAVTYYDPDRGEESNPSPFSMIQAGGENFEEDEGTLAANPFVLTNVPVSSERNRNIYRRIYKSLVDGGQLYLAKEIQDNLTQEVEVELSQITLAVGKQVELDNYPPPRCNFLAATESRLFYGGIKDNPQTVRYSKVFSPGRVPLVNELFCESTEGNPVTGLVVLSGDVIIFKRDSIFRNSVAEGAFLLERIETAVGAVSHSGITEADSQILFVSEDGIYVFSGGGRVMPLSQSIRTAWENQDFSRLPQSFAAYNRRRKQFTFAQATDKLRPFANLIFTGELGGGEEGGTVWSKLTAPMGIDALAKYDDPATDRPELLGASPGGFVFRLEGGDSHMIDNRLGLESSTVSSSSGGTITVGGAVSVHHDSPADVPVIIHKDGLVTAKSYIVEAPTSTTVTVGYSSDLSDMSNGDTIDLGGFEVAWDSKWFDAGKPGTRKRWHHLNLTLSPGTTNTVTVKIYKDLETTAFITKASVDVSSGMVEIPLGGVRAKFLKITLSSPGREHDLKIHDLTYRFIPGVDQH